MRERHKSQSFLVAATADWQVPWYITFMLGSCRHTGAYLWFGPDKFFTYAYDYGKYGKCDSMYNTFVCTDPGIKQIFELPEYKSSVRKDLLKEADTICKQYIILPPMTKEEARIILLKEKDTEFYKTVAADRDFWHKE